MGQGIIGKVIKSGVQQIKATYKPAKDRRRLYGWGDLGFPFRKVLLLQRFGPPNASWDLQPKGSGEREKNGACRATRGERAGIATGVEDPQGGKNNRENDIIFTQLIKEVIGGVQIGGLLANETRYHP